MPNLDQSGKGEPMEHLIALLAGLLVLTLGRDLIEAVLDKLT